LSSMCLSIPKSAWKKLLKLAADTMKPRLWPMHLQKRLESQLALCRFHTRLWDQMSWHRCLRGLTSLACLPEERTLLSATKKSTTRSLLPPSSGSTGDGPDQIN
ncbi:hypothetical protein LPJ55_005959, partial [Coemansia sp. RSA 990]